MVLIEVRASGRGLQGAHADQVVRCRVVRRSSVRLCVFCATCGVALGVTVAEAVSKIAPPGDYKWHDMDGVVVLRPAGAWQTRSSPA